MRISQIRKSKGLTLEEFGKLVNNAGKSVVSKWERGITVPNNERLKRISEIANVSTTYLTTGEYTEYDLTEGNKSLFTDGEYISSYIDQLEKNAKKRSIENSKIAKDFNFNEYDDLTKRLSIAINHKKNITDDGKAVDIDDATFLYNLYKRITNKRQDAITFDKDTREKLITIISLLLSNARDVDIDDIHKRITESEKKNKKE